MSEERFDRIEQSLAEVSATVGAHEHRFDKLSTQINDLGHQMRVLHESTLDAIAASSERNAVTKPQLDEAMAKLKEAIGRRLDPLEAVVRTHSADIDALKRAR